MTRYAFCILLALLTANPGAWAEPDNNDYSRIARISYMEGYVSFQNTSDVDWSAAAVNFPLQPGDRIYTGPKGRAEIQFDEGTVLRLAEGTDVQFLSLNEDLVQVRILTGLSTLTVASEVEFETDTPAAAFIALRKGVYRFDTKDNGDTNAVVRAGEMEAVSHRFVHRVQSGEQMSVTADENSNYYLSRYGQRDAWDEWTDRRNADLVARASREYLPDNVYIGVSDLDRHGRWVTVESYGAAWVPFSVSVSWSPYSVGRWCYRSGWGWTWVSYEPWGWLPYHYGRWHHSARYGWCWLPGPSFSFNFWSPGLVTFYYGPTWVSWGALGPGDYYSMNNYHYNRKRYNHQVGMMRGLHRRSPGDSINRHVRDAYRTADIEHFRNGRSHDGASRAIATKDGYRKIEEPWKRGTLVHERLAVQPTSKSFSPDPDRWVVRSSIERPKPAVVHATPTAAVAKGNGYIKVTNQKVSSREGYRNTGVTDSVSGNAASHPNSGQGRVLQNSQSRGSGPAEERSTGTAANRDRGGESRTARTNERGSNVSNTGGRSNGNKNSQSGSTVRSYPQTNISRPDTERGTTVQSAAPRNSTGINNGRSTGQPGNIGNSARSTSTGYRASSPPQNSRSNSGENIRTNRTTWQPESSRISGNSSNSSSSSRSGASGKSSSSGASGKNSSGSSGNKESSGTRKAVRRSK